MSILSNLIVRIGASTDDFDKKVNSSLGKIKRFGAEVSQAGQALAIGFSAPLIAAGGFAIKAAGDMEKLSKGLEATMKSADLAGKEMAQLKELAKLPGLGLPEAAQGSIRLQTLGTSAAGARKIMGELGNALAIVGGGRDDFAEVVRQLTQMQSVGKVTKENLDTITERIPQVSRIMIETWGPDSVGDPAKFFEKAGISSKEFIDILIGKLAEGERAGNTFNNSFENMKDAATQAAAEFGKSLLPVAQRVLDDFLTPAIQKSKELAEAFGKLSPSTQNVALGISGIMAVAPLLIVALGTIIEKTAVLYSGMNRLIPLITLARTGWAALAISGVALAIAAFIEFQDTMARVSSGLAKMKDRMVTSFGGEQRYAGVFDVMTESAKAMANEQEKVEAATKKTTDALKDHGAAIETVTVHLKNNIRETLGMNLLIEKAKLLHDEYEASVKKVAAILNQYNVATIEGAYSIITMNQALRELYQTIEDPPELRIPGLADIRGIASPGGLSPFPSGNRPAIVGAGNPNVGPTGMITEEQLERLGRKQKQVGETGRKAMQQVSTAITDTSRAMTKLIFEGGKLKDMMKNVALEAAKGFTQILIEKGINLAIKAVGSLIGKFFDLGGAMGKIFGGAASSAASTATSAAGGVGSSAAGAASSAASGSISSAISAVTGVVSAISGIIGNFQFAHMNTALGRIEESTRYLKIWTGEQSQNLLWCAQKSTEYLGYVVASLDAIGRYQSEMLANLQVISQGGGGGGGSVTINIHGGDPNAILEVVTRALKQQGVVPRYA